MPVFEYKGLSHTGREVKGILDAENPQAARSKLKKDGVYLTDLRLGKEEKASKEISLKKRITSQDIAMATRQLATLVNAGIPLVESLNALIDQIENVRLKTTLASVKDSVNEGSSLADALKSHPKVFSNLYNNMIRAGESSGTLGIVLDRLAEFTEGQMKLRNKIISMLSYPGFMILISSGVLFFLLSYVVPIVVKIYANANTVLPLPTRVLIFLSNIFSGYWYVIIAICIALFFFGKAYLSKPEGKKKYDEFVLKVPVLGNMIRMVAVSRFASTFSTLLSSGVPVLSSLDIVKNVVNSSVFAKVIAEARKNISEGQSIAEPLKKSNEFPPLVTHMIAIGEKTGELEGMLKKVAETYTNMFETRMTTMMSVLEPVMILVMAVVIGFIVVAVLLPLIQLSSTI